MKSTFYPLIFVLILTGCGERPSPPASVVTTQPAAQTLLAHLRDTRGKSEAELLAAAAAALRGGISLDAASAERCWRQEAARPVLRETCVLLWAGGGESNASLDGLLGKGGSRILAIATVMRKASLSGLDLPQFLAFLAPLAQDPWLKNEAASLWLRDRGALSAGEAAELSAALGLAESADAADWASHARLLFRLRPSHWHGLLNGYCDSATRGEARLRCWRMLGAISRDLDPEMTAQLLPFFPSRGDADWLLFVRSFPTLALNLQPHLKD